MNSLDINTRVSLPPHPPARKNSKPKPRYGTVIQPPFEWPTRALVFEDGTEQPFWKPISILEVIE